MGDRSYSKTTEAALFAISVRCYYPECQVPSVSIFGDGEKKNVDVAHICAISENGPRFNPKATKSELNSFPNLILLCGLHHRMVDNPENEDSYPVSMLRRWKSENEKDVREKLDGLSGLTESDLNEMLVTAAESTKTEIKGALDRLEDISGGAAELLRNLYAKIESAYIDSESIELLHAASMRLGHLEEGASMLQSVAVRLGSLEDGANTMRVASNQLGNLEEGSHAINAASENIAESTRRLEQVNSDYASMLRQAPDTPDLEGEVQSAGRSLMAEIDRKIETIENSEPQTVVDDDQRWKFGLGGFFAGVISVMITVAILAFNGAI